MVALAKCKVKPRCLCWHVFFSSIVSLLCAYHPQRFNEGVFRGSERGRKSGSSFEAKAGWVLRPEFAAQLEADMEGYMVKCQWEVDVPLRPLPEVQARLRRRFGMYEGGPNEPFGLQHFLPRDGPPFVNSHVCMMAAEEANINGQDQGKSFLNKLVSKMPAPVFSGREADWADFAREW